MLVKYADEKNYEKIMNDVIESEITSTYFDVIRIFTNRFGFINPDDYGQLNVLNTLSTLHSKAEIVQGIFAVIP